MQPSPNLVLRLIRHGLVDQLLLAALLFIPARTLDFWQAWAYLALHTIVTTIFCAYFLKHDPQLLERRLLRKEPLTEQKILMLIWKGLSVVSFVLVGRDHRFGWSAAVVAPVPGWLILTSLLLVLAGHLLYFQVLQANRFAASFIQVEAGQTVSATGPYRLVRHPMYLGFAAIGLFTPLALGSFIAFPVCALVIPILVFRLLNEEKFLLRDLPGYAAYCQTTRHRLIPFVW